MNLGATSLIGIVPEHSPRLARRTGIDCVPAGPVIETDDGDRSVCVNIALATKAALAAFSSVRQRRSFCRTWRILFDTSPSPDTGDTPRPLADRLRPKSLDEVIGQDKVLGPDGPLGSMLAAGSLVSLIFWGPPGVGKTTIARLLADATDRHFVQISAIFTGVADLRKVFEAAKLRRQNGQGTLLFVDEIHRFNKAQQDGFLPHMEDGSILLVGATTENPSFELNAALLSRAQVLVLERLTLAHLERLVQRAEQELDRPLPLDGPAREALLEMADGDGRALLNLDRTGHGLEADRQAWTPTR